MKKLSKSEMDDVSDAMAQLRCGSMQNMVRADLIQKVVNAHQESHSKSFQSRNDEWMVDCFGEVIAADTVERSHRFLEESLELVQACGMTESECEQLVKYVFGRPVGEKEQESGGVSITHAALCSAQGLNLDVAADKELARCWGNKEKIREKQKQKPKHSPLPA